MSSTKLRQEWLGGRNGPSVESSVQYIVQKKLLLEKWWAKHILSNQEQEQWIKDYVYRETAVARKRVQDAEMITLQVQEAMKNTQKVRKTTRKLKKTYEEILNAIGDSLSDLTNSDAEEDGED